MLTMKVARCLFSLYLGPGFSLQAFSSAVEALRLANEVLDQKVTLGELYLTTDTL